MGKERCPTRGGVLIVHTHCMDLQMQLQVANALLSAEQVSEAVKWATASALVGAPCADQLPYANFENPRQFRPCDLQVCERRGTKRAL